MIIELIVFIMRHFILSIFILWFVSPIKISAQTKVIKILSHVFLYQYYCLTFTLGHIWCVVVHLFILLFQRHLLKRFPILIGLPWWLFAVPSSFLCTFVQTSFIFYVAIRYTQKIRFFEMFQPQIWNLPIGEVRKKTVHIL